MGMVLAECKLIGESFNCERMEADAETVVPLYLIQSKIKVNPL